MEVINNGAAILPTGWALKKIRELGSVIRGASPRPKGDRRYYGGSIPRLMVEDVTRDGKIVFPQVDSLTEEGAKRSRPCKKGTLTIVCSGTVGIPSFLGVDACIHDGFLALVDIRKSISNDYLYHQFLWQKEKFDSSATHGGVFTNLTTDGVRELSIPIPIDFDEQESISRALSDMEELLAKLDQLIAKKSDIRKGTMQELLTGKRRLPNFSGEWTITRLGTLIQGCSSGATPYRGRPDFYVGEIPWITSGELNYNLITDSREKISKEAALTTNLRIVPKGTFLMAITGLEAEGTRGSCAITGIDACTNQSCMAIYPNELLTTNYLFHYYRLMGKELALQYCQGTKQQSYTARIVKLLPIELPSSIDEQNAIARILADMDEEITELCKKRSKMAAIKEGMMQQLLTGKIRLV